MSHDLKIRIDSLSCKQAVLWLLVHEKRRHEADIRKIEADIKSLTDAGVRLPAFTPEEFDVWLEVGS